MAARWSKAYGFPMRAALGCQPPAERLVPIVAALGFVDDAPGLRQVVLLDHQPLLDRRAPKRTGAGVEHRRLDPRVCEDGAQEREPDGIGGGDQLDHGGQPLRSAAGWQQREVDGSSLRLVYI